jgi:hypothetical protein
MKIVCTAVVENPQQRENLCQCVEILGGVPKCSGNTVCVEYDEGINTGKFIELFEHYITHEIRTLG